MSELIRGKAFFIEVLLLILSFLSFLLFGPGAEFILIMAGSIVITAGYVVDEKKVNKVGVWIVAAGVVLSAVKLMVEAFSS